jgi:hypothetical protein
VLVHATLKRSYRTLSFRQSSSKLDFELGTRLLHDVCDPSNDIAREQAHNEPVRVLKHNCVTDDQVMR